MYTKLFRSLFDGSLYGRLEPVTVFLCLLAHADQHGEVDLSPQRIAGCLGCDLDFVQRGLTELLAPDPMSRTPVSEGRRLMPLLNEEGKPRAFGWRLVNYQKYRSIRSEDDRRDYQRQWDRENRLRGVRHNPTASDKSDTVRQHPTQEEAEEEESLKPLSGGKPPDDALAGKSDPKTKARQQARASAARAIDYLNEKAGTHFRAVEANLKLAVARIVQDGATEQDLRAVVDFKVAEVERGQFDRKYLRPATLWSAEKFAQYLGQVGARAPAAKEMRRPTMAQALVELQDGKLVPMAEYPAGLHIEIARTFAREYSSRIARGTVRNVVIKIGAEQRRFTAEELAG